ncbi:MAG: hypothetical protein QM715_01465 [Nibricoccus sp.]
MKAGPTTISRMNIDAQKNADTWAANPGFSLGDMTLPQFVESQSKAVKLSEQVEAKRLEMIDLANQRDAAASVLRTMITRVRSGFRAVYGPDSTQYEQAGGVRSSDRKKAGSRKAAETKS